MYLSSTDTPVHLTYCLNIHPGESWPENFASIRREACAVRQAVSPDKPFGLGLRLSAQAAGQLADPARLREFQQFLSDQGLYVFTINGFPYGTFHGTAVKEAVYAPDWSSRERVDYTSCLIQILAALLPEGVSGSISTVPGTYRAWCTSSARHDSILLGLAEAAAMCARARQETGRLIRIAIEPEPDCIWDKGAHLIELFQQHLPGPGSELLSKKNGVSLERARAMLAEHIGVCLDTCHQAVLFEPVAATLRGLVAAQVPIAKIQVSAAPRCTISPAALEQLKMFEDDVYLHQTAIRMADGTVKRYPDLEPALADARHAAASGGELRTHFHIPLFADRFGALQSTRDELDCQFFGLLRSGIASHIEIETYTFSVLPEVLQKSGVVESIVSELKWFLDEWRASGIAVN